MAAADHTRTSARARGEAHGERWRDEIRELAARRGAIAGASGADLSPAATALRGVRRWDPELAEELEGVASAAGLSDESLALLNHDLPGAGAEESTALFLPAGVDGAALLILRLAVPGVRAEDWRVERVGDTSLLTFPGCLGWAGVRVGLGVTLNGLHCSARDDSGLVRAALVHGLLKHRELAGARAFLEGAALHGSWHVVAVEGRAREPERDPAERDALFAAEVTGARVIVTRTGARAAHIHTNHCFDPSQRRGESVPRSSDTFRRLTLATTLYVQQRPSGPDPGAAYLRALDPDPPRAALEFVTLIMRPADGGATLRDRGSPGSGDNPGHEDAPP